jgi:hypothetical protein
VVLSLPGLAPGRGLPGRRASPQRPERIMPPGHTRSRPRRTRRPRPASAPVGGLGDPAPRTSPATAARRAAMGLLARTWPRRTGLGPRGDLVTGTRRRRRPVPRRRPGAQHAHHGVRRGQRSPAGLPPGKAGLGRHSGPAGAVTGVRIAACQADDPRGQSLPVHRARDRAVRRRRRQGIRGHYRRHAPGNEGTGHQFPFLQTGSPPRARAWVERCQSSQLDPRLLILLSVNAFP